MRRRSRTTHMPAGADFPSPPTPPTISRFRRIVLDYYHHHGRDLAWRRTTDPYHILVSEIMLQQTQVERVSAKYPAFIAAFPDFASIAGASLRDVLDVWQGMGYNRRAMYLRQCARRALEEYDGILPRDPAVLATFPGIGRATAASVCAFAFNMPVVFIETNIRRVFIHFFFSGADGIRDTDILPFAERALYRSDPRQWYNALMDLGTELKKTAGVNPNRRSRHYAKQTVFAGSDREIRGGIIRILIAERRMTGKTLALRLRAEPGRIGRILGDLEEEGLVTRTGIYFALASR